MAAIATVNKFEYESNGLSRLSQSMIGVSQATYSKLSQKKADTNWV